MADVGACPGCGANLTADSPGGLCPECLISAGLGDEGADSREVNVVTTPLPGGFLPPRPEALAEHFPQLEILESLGHGGMGAVYKARQQKLDRFVALKILRPESADDPAFAERFNREARTLARLQHPNIVAIHDFGEIALSTSGDSGEKPRRVYYFVMEYVDGASLRQMIAAGDLTPDQSMTIVAQICEALQYAHDEHVVHRDIKPENVLVDSRGRVKIADFGLAKLAARSPEEFTLTGTHQVMGTPRYMAPEQMEGSHLVDHRADIYSLGVMFYEMLTGQVPAGHFEPPSKKNNRVDPRIDQIVLRALAREPHHRYRQVNDLKADVAVVAGSSVMNSIENVAPLVASVAGIAAEPVMSEYDCEMLRMDVRGPAGGLILVSFLGPGFWVVTCLGMIFQSHWYHDELAFLWGGLFAAILGGIFICYSGLKMRNLQAYEFCIAASILVIIPWSPVALLGIPVGIWCLRTLHRPDIKAAFVRESLRQRGLDDVPVPMPPRRPPPPPPKRHDPRSIHGPSTFIDRGVDAFGRLFKGN